MTVELEIVQKEDLMASLIEMGALHRLEAECYLRCLSNGHACYCEALLHWHGWYRERPAWALLSEALCNLGRPRLKELEATFSPKQLAVLERMSWRASSLVLTPATWWVGYPQDQTHEVVFAPVEAEPWLRQNGRHVVTRVHGHAARFHGSPHTVSYTGPWFIRPDAGEAVHACIHATYDASGFQ